MIRAFYLAMALIELWRHHRHCGPECRCRDYT